MVLSIIGTCLGFIFSFTCFWSNDVVWIYASPIDSIESIMLSSRMKMNLELIIAELRCPFERGRTLCFEEDSEVKSSRTRQRSMASSENLFYKGYWERRGTKKENQRQITFLKNNKRLCRIITF